MQAVVIAVFMVALIVAIAKALKSPSVALALLFTLLPVKQVLMAKFPVFAEHSPLANLLIGAVILLSWCRMRSRKERVWTPTNRVAELSISFAFLAFASILWAPDPQYAFHGLSVTVSYVILLYFFFPQLLADENTFREMIKSFTWIATITSIALLFGCAWLGRGVIFDLPPVWLPDYGAWVPQTGNPLEAATMAMRVSLIVLLLNASVLGKFVTFWRWPMLAVAVALMLRSETRGSIVAMGVTLLIFFPLARGHGDVRKTLGTIGIIIVLAAVAFWVQTYASSSARWSSDVVSRDSHRREYIITQSLKVWHTTGIAGFLFGHGYDGSFLPDLEIPFPEVGLAALVVDLGLVGLLLWLAIAFLGVRSWVRCFRMVRHDEVRRAYVAVLGALPFSEWLLSLKGAGYLHIIGWCIFIARYENLLIVSQTEATEYSQEYEMPQLASGVFTS